MILLQLLFRSIVLDTSKKNFLNKDGFPTQTNRYMDASMGVGGVGRLRKEKGQDKRTLSSVL